MPDGKLRALVRSRFTYDEIAEANGRETGWTPTRSGVLRKIERLGEPPRHASHTDLTQSDTPLYCQVSVVSVCSLGGGFSMSTHRLG
jgi:hypothetical protein